MPLFRKPAVLRSGQQSPSKERRNLRTRANLGLLSRSGGPVRYWTFGIVIAIAIAAVVGWRVLHPAADAPPVIAYSELSRAIAAGQVRDVLLDEGDNRVLAELTAKQLVYGRVTNVVTATIPPRGVSVETLDRWSQSGARVRVAEQDRLHSPEQIIQLLSFAALLGMIGFLVVRSRGGATRTRFAATPPSRRLTLADVGGAREAQADLRDVIAYLKDPERFRNMGAKCPKGILLVGPPGTGKTLLARAVAGEAGVPVIQAAGSDFNEMYVGVGSKRVRQLAKQARDAAPCIVFIDEFDSLGGRRGRPNRSGEEEVTLNQLLVEMDGMAGSEGVVWMAATNREDMLDPAVRRPGRFDRVVEVSLPTTNDRLEILKIHAKTSKLAADVDLERLAALTVGHSGAELANLLNEAAIIAVHADSSEITNAHIEQARDKILLGRVRSGVTVSEDERRLVALHEAGHAIVGLVACPEDKLHKVTIEARGRTLGAAHFAPDVDRHLHTRRYLLGLIAKALGGRAAELEFFGPEAITSGAGGDLVQATNVARRMVADFGMSEQVGLVSADASAQGGQPSSQLMSQIDTAVRALIREQADRAEALVREHRAAVEAVAQALLEKDVLSADEVITIARAQGVHCAQQLSAA
ncbi:ATP-dependent metalloprotease FtsH [Gemmatirosa kalamazoonensis]|uniref:ATP-dependent metalloprotease FtsH n=1 Tax=Gemmatirosa kalamazoonensis TaxID=861299 RepID=W0RIF8_9BACT|nr:AAA family ATPase [Gemmatirosa kalamazoonensis]AHG90571.1 ATP-dependent metalloprotease FtsH [Gemmatirosa kalamazoonensis]